ncbi:cyclic nucleotide-gated ion channel 1 [Tanacetum coccineum]
MRKTLNPRGKFLQKWNKIFVLSCVIVVSVDQLFFYIPIVKDVKKCLDLDNKLQITASVLRTFTNIFYIVHIIFQFRTGFIAPSSRVFGRGVLVEDAWEIAKRYMSSYFLVDILAVLPLLPQEVNKPYTEHFEPLDSSSMHQYYITTSLRIGKVYIRDSLGQNLQTSTFVWEICFAVVISIAGLVLFSFLIRNIQTYLQSTTIRLEEMRETQGVDEDCLIRNLPQKRHKAPSLSATAKKGQFGSVPMFEKMDDQLMDAMCDRLKPVLYTEHSYIVRERDPVDEMLFVMRGKLLTVTTNGDRTGHFNSDHLKASYFCGEELLTWALDPHTSSNLPISTRTVQALEEVEAFALTADDLKFVASQFRRLHSKQLRHTFRFYSQQWRMWAACFIWAAWRRHCRKNLEDSLREEEEHRMQNALTGAGGSSPRDQFYYLLDRHKFENDTSSQFLADAGNHASKSYFFAVASFRAPETIATT